MVIKYPDLFWQHGYNKRWISYSHEECCVLNKAFFKKQKTVTLPSIVAKKKLIVNLEKMFQTNSVSGYQQLVRCLVYNDLGYICWTWEDDYKDFISYAPYYALYLEVALEKKLEKVDVLVKDQYEIDLRAFIQTNKETGFIRRIRREKVDFVVKDKIAFDALHQDLDCQDFIKRMAEESEQSIKQIYLGLPLTNVESNEISEFNSEGIVALHAEISASGLEPPSSVPVDPLCPVAEKCHVYCEESDLYHAMLNLTSLQANNNKFYNIQLLKFDKQKKFAIWLHWGRVGYKGQTNLIEYKKLDEAKSMFEKKFFDKTKNYFKDRHNFQKAPGKYDLLHSNFSSEVHESLPTAETKLDKKIQSLLELICNKTNLEEAARDLSYDSKAIPLGKITAKQIVDGYTALRNIAEIIKTKGVGKDLVEECNVFYTKIPHDFGRRTPPLIRSLDDVTEKLRMLEVLSNICLAMDMLTSSDGVENPIDIYYRQLECNMMPLEPGSCEFQVLKKCLKDTQAPSHNYTLEIIDAFKCIKENQESSFIDYGNNKLLWHGSRISNWLSILKKGLQIAPPEAPSSGYMFGKGIYFADIPSKSANYCFATKRKNEGLLLLSEVSLGKQYLISHAANLENLPSPYNSVFALGKLLPKVTESLDDVPVSCGPFEERDSDDLSLNYNEYIVYNIHQVKMKYLLRVKFIY